MEKIINLLLKRKKDASDFWPFFRCGSQVTENKKQEIVFGKSVVLFMYYKMIEYNNLLLIFTYLELTSEKKAENYIHSVQLEICF